VLKARAIHGFFTNIDGQWRRIMTTRILFIQGGGAGAHAEDTSLVESFKQSLGSGYDVRFPRMPNESDPDVEAWKVKIASDLSHVPGEAILCGHSVGGSILLRYLSEEKVEKSIAGLFLLAAPAWDGDRWDFGDLKLCADVAEKFATIPRIVFYHCRDDDIVPFAHLALHGARIPQAMMRAFDRGGHQFDGELAAIASDIRARVV
jgi:predicted alpha/beta hydrolase family esterase